MAAVNAEVAGPRPIWNRFDLVWLVFLAGLALLPPVTEIHKQEILALIGLVQIFQSFLIARVPHGREVVVLLQTALSTLLLAHTVTGMGGDIPINSTYYQIYYIPVITAALYYGLWGSLIWTTLAAGAYCSYLVPALREFELTRDAADELAIRILFFYLAALIVNRITTEMRRQRDLYRQAAATLEVTNRQLQKAEEGARRSERLAALGQLSAGLAHEIRNPLAVMRGSAEMLQRKVDASNPLAAELAGNISGEVNRLNVLVSRFLDFARPLRVKPRLQPVAPVLDRALRAVKERYPELPVRVIRDDATDLPKAWIDDALSEQVFGNLAANAYEAMGEKGGVLRVTTMPAHHKDQPGVEVSFADNGPGVAPEMQAQVFNPFVTTKDTGVGLGLAIVSKIVDEHRGYLRLRSEPGRGAEFTIFLPAEEAASAARSWPQS